MSLINQMLQDLEERRSDGIAGGPQHGAVRAAPVPRKISAAWWGVLVLVLLLTAGSSWFLGRQSAPAVPPVALKLAPDLKASSPAKSSAISAPPTATMTNTAGNPDVPARDLVPSNSVVAMLPSVPVSAPLSGSTPVPVSAAAGSTATVSAPAAASAPATAKTKVSDPVIIASVPRKTSAFDLPANVTKQVKDLTAQQRAENEYRKAGSLIQQGRSTEAAGVLEQALLLDPHHVVARQTRVGLLLESKRHDDAVRMLQDGVALDRTQPALAMMLARLQVEKGEVKPALETLQKTLPYGGERADYQAFLAALFQREGRHKEAVESYAMALHKSPQNGLWWMGIAISLQAENRLPEARDAFGRAKASATLSPELQAFVQLKLNQLQ